MDVTQALRDAENTLRDFISSELRESTGDDWIDKCGVTSERVAQWKARKATEERRQESGVVEERLLYYADFYDLPKILKAHWAGTFSEVFGDWKTMEVFLNELGRLRDPDAHRRELLPHQKALAVGISGEIRTRIVRYRSKKETADDCFPRIESVRDSLGNIWTGESDLPWRHTKMILRPGDSIDYVVTATDPDGGPLKFAIGNYNHKWQDSNELTKTVTCSDVGKNFEVRIEIKSNKIYHAHGDHDDSIAFLYTVLPSSEDLGKAEAEPNPAEIAKIVAERIEANPLAGVPLS